MHRIDLFKNILFGITCQNTAESIASSPWTAIRFSSGGFESMGHFTVTRAGGCQVPSPGGRIEGGVVFGQYRRMTR